MLADAVGQAQPMHFERALQLLARVARVDHVLRGVDGRHVVRRGTLVHLRDGGRVFFGVVFSYAEHDFRAEFRFHEAHFGSHPAAHFVGISAGAVCQGALQVAKELGPNKRVVALLPDLGERYLSHELFTGLDTTDRIVDATKEDLPAPTSTAAPA